MRGLLSVAEAEETLAAAEAELARVEELERVLELTRSFLLLLFSQETEVLRWAEQHLKEPRHRLWHLPGWSPLM